MSLTATVEATENVASELEKLKGILYFSINYLTLHYFRF